MDSQRITWEKMVFVLAGIIIAVVVAFLIYMVTNNHTVTVNNEAANVQVIEPTGDQKYEDGLVLIASQNPSEKIKMLDGTEQLVVEVKLPEQMSVEMALKNPGALLRASNIDTSASNNLILQPDYTYRLLESAPAKN